MPNKLCVVEDVLYHSQTGTGAALCQATGLMQPDWFMQLVNVI